MAEGGEEGPGCWQGAGESACLSLRGRRQWREGDAGQLRRKQGGGRGTPGSPVPGILQAGTLEWGAIAFSNEDLAQPKIKVKILKISKC